VSSVDAASKGTGDDDDDDEDDEDDDDEDDDDDDDDDEGAKDDDDEVSSAASLAFSATSALAPAAVTVASASAAAAAAAEVAAAAALDSSTDVNNWCNRTFFFLFARSTALRPKALGAKMNSEESRDCVCCVRVQACVIVSMCVKCNRTLFILFAKSTALRPKKSKTTESTRCRRRHYQTLTKKRTQRSAGSSRSLLDVRNAFTYQT
jgi:hypothetical protein